MGAEVQSLTNLGRTSDAVDEPDEFVGPVSSRYLMVYGDPRVLASWPPEPDEAPEPAGRASREASAEVVDRRAHIYLGVRTAPSHRVFLQLKLVAPRRGFIMGCAIAAGAIAALMSVAFLNLTAAGLHLEPTVVLLSVVPVVLGYVLVRPGEHALERYHITGVRAMALLAGGNADPWCADPGADAQGKRVQPATGSDLGGTDMGWASRRELARGRGLGLELVPRRDAQGGGSGGGCLTVP